MKKKEVKKTDMGVGAYRIIKHYPVVKLGREVIGAIPVGAVGLFVQQFMELDCNLYTYIAS